MSEDTGTPKRANARQTHDALLHAAGRIVRRDGVARLTLDAVAAEAGVSKGGVLYHFRTKETLIGAFVEGVAEAFQADLASVLATDDGPVRGRLLRAYVRTATMPDPVPDLTAGLIAAVAWDARLSAAIQTRFAEWHDQALDDLADPTLGRIVCLAADGLWLSEWFGFGIAPAAEREAVMGRLLSLAVIAANPIGGPPGADRT